MTERLITEKAIQAIKDLNVIADSYAEEIALAVLRAVESHSTKQQALMERMAIVVEEVIEYYSGENGRVCAGPTFAYAAQDIMDEYHQFITESAS